MYQGDWASHMLEAVRAKYITLAYLYPAKLGKSVDYLLTKVRVCEQASLSALLQAIYLHVSKLSSTF